MKTVGDWPHRAGFYSKEILTSSTPSGAARKGRDFSPGGTKARLGKKMGDPIRAVVLRQISHRNPNTICLSGTGCADFTPRRRKKHFHARVRNSRVIITPCGLKKNPPLPPPPPPPAPSSPSPRPVLSSLIFDSHSPCVSGGIPWIYASGKTWDYRQHSSPSDSSTTPSTR